MEIILLSRSLFKYNAVGNDVTAMYNILKEHFTCTIYAEHISNTDIVCTDKSSMYNALNNPNSIVIYHHALYWEYGEELLKKANGRIVFRYHNVTPPEFFGNYSSMHEDVCNMGRKQTERFMLDYPNAVWLCNSKFTATDLWGLSEENIYICPPFNLTEVIKGATPDRDILQSLQNSGDINLLFVGRFAPNKGHLFLINVLNSYMKHFDSNIKLHIVGDKEYGLDIYYQEVMCKIMLSGLRGRVNIAGDVNDAQLSAYYKACDFFVSASEHEGFMVPIVEAQCMGLPIIAKKSSAVSETIGDNQVLLGDNAAQYAAAIYVLRKNTKYYDYLQKSGEINFTERFSNNVITNIFIDFFRKCFRLIV